MKEYKPKTFFEVMPYGKRKGDLIGTVIEDDPSYVRWLVENTGLVLDEVALKYLEENE